MKDCKLCKGAGVRQIPPTVTPWPSSVWWGTGVTRALWPWALCSCVVSELETLRTALTGAGLLPVGHWTRSNLPMPAKTADDEHFPASWDHRAELLSYVVLSTRSDGYRVVYRGKLTHLGGRMYEAQDSSGGILADPDDGHLMWWASVEDAERMIDQLQPLEAKR